LFYRLGFAPKNPAKVKTPAPENAASIDAAKRWFISVSVAFSGGWSMNIPADVKVFLAAETSQRLRW